MSEDRSSTATRLRALGSQAAERVYRAQRRRLRKPVRTRLTGRAALLALLVCSLAVGLAYPLRQYIDQRSRIDDLRQEVEQRKQRVRELRKVHARWQDPAFVRQRARARLHLVLPGEVSYIFLGGKKEDSGDEDEGGDGGRGGEGTNEPWYRVVLEGVDRADKPGEADATD